MRLATPHSSKFLALAIALAGMFSCSLDPVHDDAVEALGGEDPAYPEGQYHRAGQPCLVCHGAQGPADGSKFLLAGTVFAGPNKPIPVKDAEVRIVTADKTTRCFKTNCRGNFFVRPEQFSFFRFPILVNISKNGQTRIMQGHIGREGSCGSCHRPVKFADSPGQIALGTTDIADEAIPDEVKNCPPAEPEAELRECAVVPQ